MMQKRDVTAAVIRCRGKILLCSRSGSKPLSQYWEFPGGKCEPGESLSQCLQREMREELGAGVIVLDPIGENIVGIGDKCYHLHFLRTMLCPDSPEPVPREGQTMLWVNTADLAHQPILPGDVHIAELLAKFANS